MARKLKAPNHAQKWQARDRVRRRERARFIRRYILIVCEGVRTEPNYFHSFRESLPPGVLEVCELIIEGAGKNTESLVEEALEIKDKWQESSGRPVDKLWVVFDRDSFAPQSFNNAINKCIQDRPNIDAAWSNEAFELWYLLHLIYFDNAIRRTEYQRMLEEQLSQKMGTPFKYQKNSKEMFSILNQYGSQGFAIENAERLEKIWGTRKDYASQKPRTKVYELIKEFKDLIEQYANPPKEDDGAESE